jgi:PAS domain S-box-containing protein
MLFPFLLPQCDSEFDNESRPVGGKEEGQVNSQIVLIVDDDSHGCERVTEILGKEGYLAVPAASRVEANGLAGQTEPGSTFLDADPQDGSISQFISDLKELSPDWECITASVSSTSKTPERAADPEQIVTMIRNAFMMIRRREESQRIESHSRYDERYLTTLLLNTEDAVFVKDTSLRYVLANPATLRWFNLTTDDLIGRRNDETALPFDRNAFDREKDVLLGKKTEAVVTSTHNGAPEIRRVVSIPIRERQGSVIGLMSIARDISEKKMLEDKLNQAQKMEAIGVLAGGIAHDFNNILGAIVGYVELARLDAVDGSRERVHLTEVLKAAQRASDLVKQILSFSRPNPHKVKPVRIGKIVADCLQLVRASLPASIEIVFAASRDPGVVLIDVTQIHQVLMNLASNASHAMAAHGGKLTVSIENIRLSSAGVPAGCGLLPGEYVQIDVSDTGHGMDELTIQKIFEPYFTTKDEGVGTGLGLAVVRNIAAAAGGAVTVESEVNKGSTFHIYLPRIEVMPEEGVEYARPYPSGNERILYVDDEGMLADIGKKMFENLGYSVIAETNPLLALDIFRAHPDRFDLIITDQTMPNMTGVEMARQILKIRPDIPVVICSGFTESPEYEEAGRLGITHFLRKPIIMKEFAEVVRSVLDDKNRRSHQR